MNTIATSRVEGLRRTFVSKIIGGFEVNGWKLAYIFDGEAYVYPKNLREAVDEVMSVEEASVVFDKEGKKAWVLVIPSNDEDLVTDHTDIQEVRDVIDPIIEWAEQLSW